MIVVAGEALVDLVIAPEGRVTAALGGGPFNTARAAARLGASVRFLGTLSNDRFGTMLAEQLVNDGVDVGNAPRTERPTTLAAAELDPSGAAQYRFYIAGTSAPLLMPSDLGSLRPVPDLVFTGGLGLVLEPMAETIVAFVEGAPDSTTVVVDVNSRPKVIDDRDRYLGHIERVLTRADIVKVSDEDLEYLMPGLDSENGAQQLLGKGPAAIVVTHGSSNTLVTTRAGSRLIPVPPLTAPVVDTIGAGDTFGASLITAIAGSASRGDLRGEHALDELGRAVSAAHEAAAVVVTRRGADPPWRHELRAGWSS